MICLKSLKHYIILSDYLNLEIVKTSIKYGTQTAWLLEDTLC